MPMKDCDRMESYVRWMDDFLTSEEKVELLSEYLKALKEREKGVEQGIKALQENN